MLYRKYNNLVNYDFLFTENKCQWRLQLEKDIKDNKKPTVDKIYLKEGNYNINKFLDDTNSKYHDDICLLKSYVEQLFKIYMNY